MDYTTRPSAVLPILALLAAGASLQLFGEVDPSQSNETIRFEQPGRYIVELEAPAILEAKHTAAKAGRDLDFLLSRLREDIGKIAGGNRGPVANSVTRGPRPRISHEYRRSFAGAAVELDPALVGELRALEYVREVHPDRTVRKMLSSSVAQIGASDVWKDYEIEGQGSVVAIVDTGIDYTHPALGEGFGPEYKVIGGADFVNDDDDPIDDEGHGTHVAGIVAADGIQLRGVAPKAKLLAYKVLDETGGGFDSWILAAIEQIVEARPDVVNMSFGRPAAHNDPVTRAIDNASTEDILFVVAAGNSGRFIDIGAPANSLSALTVGAIDRGGSVAGFSSRGPRRPDGALKPEIVAPGVDIVSAGLGGGTLTASGTSMAAPHVAGAAALLRSAHPDWSDIRIRTALISSARSVEDDIMARGAGLVDVRAAVATALTPYPSSLAFGVIGGTNDSHELKADLYVTNHTERTHTISFSATSEADQFRPSVSPETIDIAAGAARKVGVTIAFDRAEIGIPAAGSLSFGGQIRLESAAGAMSVPWSLVRAHKITVEWEDSESAEVRLGNGSMVATTRLGPPARSATLFIGSGDLSVWARDDSFADKVIRHIVLDDIDPATTGKIALTNEDAPLEVTILPTGPAGDPLPLNEIRRTHYLLHPGFALSLLDAYPFLEPDWKIRTSPLDSSVAIQVFDELRAGDDYYLVQYPAVTGIEENVELQLEPGAWVRVELAGISDPDLTDLRRTIWMGHSLRVGQMSLTSISTPAEEPPTALTTASLWGYPGSSSNARSFLVTSVEDFATTGNPLLRSELHLTRDGFLPLNLPPNREAPDGTLIPNDSYVALGRGPLSPVSFAGSDPEGRFVGMVWWRGSYFEDLCDTTAQTRVDLRDANGDAVEFQELPPGPCIVSPAPKQVTAELPSPGEYRFTAEAVHEGAAGRRWSATLEIGFDTSREDVSSPVIGDCRLASGGGARSNVFGPGERATLRYGVLETTASGIGPFTPRIEYRTAGGTWQELPYVLSPVRPGGIVDVEVDLQPMTSSARGFVDLRVMVTDAAGNYTRLELEDAALVTTGRRRGASH